MILPSEAYFSLIANEIIRKRLPNNFHTWYLKSWSDLENRASDLPLGGGF